MDNELDNASEMPADLPWQLLEEITNGFSEERKIGSGGYGVVYKGVYKNGEEIAVKKLYHMPGLDDKQFQNELRSLTRLRHQNIVRLVGKTYEERDRCVEYEGKLVCAKMIDRVICLEYLHNGSLEKHLSDESSGLPWHKRYKIIKGICDGLNYLHECGIFHLDLKPANILLDKNMEPKIADFGLSRLFSGTRQSHTTSKFIGTLGYVPPEYIEKGKISDKFDVFSLGVIIIGIMTGPDGYSKHSDMSSKNIVERVLENWKNRSQEQWKDESYFVVFCQLRVCILIALTCVETDRHKRPSIGDIICKLNELETYTVLARGFFCTIDVHLTEPWILTNHGYNGIQILNYRTQATVKSFELGNIPSGGYGPVNTAKFIARKQWFVVGGCDGSIRVYCYRTMQEVKGFVAHSSWVASLAIHPTEPFVLSSSDSDLNIKLWDWEKCWECTRIFEMRSWVREIAFNPKDTNTFATGYVDGRAEIWNLGSPDSSFTLGEDKYTGCLLDYFARGDRQYLITASYGVRTAKIWDLQNKSCIKTLGHKKRVTAVCSHPELPILMTGSDGTVYLWNSTTFRVQRTFNFGLGEVFAFGCIKGSRRVVIGHLNGLAMMEIRDTPNPPILNEFFLVSLGRGRGSGGYKRRTQVSQGRRKELRSSMDDGYSWRKYGQKEIFAAKYPRSYFRCKHKHEQLCPATRQVQQSEADPSMLEITYIGDHTCTQNQQAIMDNGIIKRDDVLSPSTEFESGRAHRAPADHESTHGDDGAPARLDGTFSYVTASDLQVTFDGRCYTNTYYAAAAGGDFDDELAAAAPSLGGFTSTSTSAMIWELISSNNAWIDHLF